MWILDVILWKVDNALNMFKVRADTNSAGKYLDEQLELIWTQLKSVKIKGRGRADTDSAEKYIDEQLELIRTQLNTWMNSYGLS